MQRHGEPRCPQAAVIEGLGRKPLPQLRWLTLDERSVARALPLNELPAYADQMVCSLQSQLYGGPPD
jgi:hypothetical protein